jgi:hypothetical protein
VHAAGGRGSDAPIVIMTSSPGPELVPRCLMEIEEGLCESCSVIASGISRYHFEESVRGGRTPCPIAA